MGVFEVLTFTDEIRKMIREGSDPKSIIEQARKNDFMLMREDGVLKAMRGKTTLEELFRAVD
jgi:type II secretory ATPase GspE/PulE/Tfp pilus assembly ATPase PilB-like protein